MGMGPLHAGVIGAAATLGPLLLGVSLSMTSYAVSASKGLAGGLPGGVSLVLHCITGYLITPWLTSRTSQMNAVAVFVGVLAFGWLWRQNAEQGPMREVFIRNEAGDLLGQTRSRPVRVPGVGIEFQVQMNDGSTMLVQIPPRPRAPGEGPPGRPWMRGSDMLWWILGISALAVAIGAYPIIRRVTQRLENLRRGVERRHRRDPRDARAAARRERVARRLPLPHRHVGRRHGSW